MAKYESKVKQVYAPVERVYATLQNMENLRPILENAQNNPQLREQLEKAGQDPSQLDKLKDVELTPDSIAIPSPMVGTISLRIIEREENKTIKFETDQSPIEANMWIQLLPTNEIVLPDGSLGSRLKLTLKADLNPMVKMMIGSKLEEGIDKFADMLAMIRY